MDYSLLLGVEKVQNNKCDINQKGEENKNAYDTSIPGGSTISSGGI
jgi:hypothetical protein